MSRASEDWAEVVERLADGDQLACLKLSRLVTGLLAGWRAYDFRQDWSDVVQDVLIALVVGAREGRIRNRAATYGYIRTVARNKFADRLERHVGRKQDQPFDGIEELVRLDAGDGPRTTPPDVLADVRLALERLPEAKRRVVYGVYGQGRTYEQVAKDTGTPLGTVKRHLREGLAELRRSYRAVASEKEPEG